MAIIHIRNTEQDIEVFEESLVTSLLVLLQREGVPVQAHCGGRAKCGRCAVRIVQGARYLTKKREREAARLETLGAEADVRLACQTFTRGDISIEILNIDS
jgi:adenylate cyclase